MPITSWTFVLFVLATLGIYNAVPLVVRRSVLLVSSLTFCAMNGVGSLLLLCALIALTYYAGRLLAKHRGRFVLAATVVLVLLPLITFKWQLWGAAVTLASAADDGWVMPLGLSFVTFHSSSYLVDIYRAEVAPARSLQAIALYIAFFPKLMAGPIERAHDFLSQVQVVSRSHSKHVYAGVKTALWGFFCKLVVADNLSSVVDRILHAPQHESGASLVAAFGLYSFQLYFDFLGYTNIAIGVALCFNITLNPNFARPYAATSIRDFWRRWHISLSSWFRDYVYIPLGGSRTHGVKRAGQIATVFLLSGIWHGAALRFAVWGLFHAAMYAVEEQLRRRVHYKPHPILAVPLTFAIVTTGWIFFRLPDMATIREAFRRIAGLDIAVPYSAVNPVLLQPGTVIFGLILLSALVLDSSDTFRTSLRRIPNSRKQIAGELAYVNWIVLALLLLGDLGVRDFTYRGF